MNRLINFFRKRTPVGFLQLKHDPGRLVTAVAGVAFADILILMQMGFLNALFDSSVKFHQSLNTDLVIINSEATNLTELSTFSRRRLYQSQDIPGVMTTEAIYINSVRWKNPQTLEKTSILVIGIDPDAQSLSIPEVQEDLDRIKLPYTFLFDRGSRGKYQQIISQVEKGKIVTTEIDRNTIAIGGLFRLGASFGADATLISSQDNFLRLFPKKDAGIVSLGLIRLESTANPELVKQNLNTYFADLKDVKVMTLNEFITMEKVYWAANRPVGIIFGFSMVIGFIVGIVIVYQVLSADVNAHLSEYATFQAMGYRYGFLLGIIFEQALILAILGFIPGVTISLGLYSLARKASYLPLTLTLFRGTIVFVLTLIMCAISGAIATRQLKYADPADMF